MNSIDRIIKIFSKRQIIICIVFLLCMFVFVNIFEFSEQKKTSYSIRNGYPAIVDFKEDLCSKEFYDTIQCRTSAEYHVKTILCMHDLKRDEVVSVAIASNGVWEGDIVKQFTDYVHNNSDWLVLDVGAQIGQYSLFAAEMGRDVVSVEPFIDNILRFQKAVRLAKLEKRITLVKNALSNKRGEVKRLHPVYVNIGGQSLLDHKDEVYKKEEMSVDKYLVETILFDDLVDILPKKPDGSDYKKAILKLDIEGFEPFAFQNSTKLLNKLDIQVIFMEWHFMNQNRNTYTPLIENLLNTLTERRLVPYANNNKLNMTNWTEWPNDIYWIKE